MADSRDIIFFGGIEWNSVVSLPVHHVVQELSKRHRVFYVDNFGGGRPVTFRDLNRIGRKLKLVLSGRKKTGSIAQEVSVNVYQPVLVPLPQIRAISRLNGRLLARGVRRLMRRYNIVDPLIWTRVRTDTALEAIRRIPHGSLVLQVVDNLSFHPYITGKMRARMLESDSALTAMADVVFVSASGLLDERKKTNPNVHFFPNGVNPEPYSDSIKSRPRLLENIKGPIVIFAGNIGPWVDLPLISSVANALPDVSFVLMGPHRVDNSILEEIGNVYLPGPVPYSELVGYYRWSNMGIIPYRVTDFTTYTFPSKLFEYLAAGLPVVATQLPELRQFGKYVSLAERPQDFAEAIRSGLAQEQSEDEKKARKDLVAEYSWTNIVAGMESHIAKTLVR